jgi:hypothetical protein
VELNVFELAVLEKLLDGEHPVLRALRRQLVGLTVTKREYTGAGFYTTFSSDSSKAVPTLAGRNVRFGDVQAAIPGLSNGAGFVLFIDGGLVRMLEGYSFEEPWPATIASFALAYSSNDRRRALTKLE